MKILLPPMEDPHDDGLNFYGPGLSLMVETVTNHVAKAYFMKEDKRILPPDGFELTDTRRREVCKPTKVGSYFLTEKGSYELRFDGMPVVDLERPQPPSTLVCNAWACAGVFNFETGFHPSKCPSTQ
jgi:hypothetical protein